MESEVKQNKNSQEYQAGPNFIQRPFIEKLTAFVKTSADYLKKGLAFGAGVGIAMGFAGMFAGVTLEDLAPLGNPDQTIYEFALKSVVVGFVGGFVVGLYEKHRQSKVLRFP